MESEYMCELCNKPWATIEDYNDHMLTYDHWKDIDSFYRVKVDNTDPVVEVKECNPESQSTSTEVSSVSENDKSENETMKMQDNVSENVQMNENAYTCELCCRSWQSVNDYNKHMLNYNHWKDKIFQANMDGSGPLQKTNENALSEEDLKNCKLCGKQFQTPEIAKIHYDSKNHQKKMMLSKHSARKFFGECKICKKVFSGAEQQNSHFKSAKHLLKAGIITEGEQLGEPESQMETVGNAKWCKLCDKFFSSTEEAAMHFYGIKHQKKLAMTKTKETNNQNAINSTDRRLVETSQEIIVTYLTSSSKPAVRQILENETQCSYGDMMTLLEKAVEYVVVNTLKCEICKKNFKGSKQGKIHLLDKRHICRVDEAKILLMDGSFSAYRNNSNENSSISETEQQHRNVPENTWETPSYHQTIQQSAELSSSRRLTLSNSEGKFERQDQYNRNASYSDKYGMSSNHPNTTETSFNGLRQTELTANDIYKERYERRSERHDLQLNQPNNTNSLFQAFSPHITQSPGCNIYSNFSNRSLNDQNHTFTTTFGSAQEHNRFNAFSQNDLSSLIQYPKVATENDRYLSSEQTLERDYRYQNKRERSSERDRDYQLQGERDRLSPFEGSSKRKNYEYSSERKREQKSTRWEKNSSENFRERDTQWNNQSNSNSYRAREFCYNTSKPERFSSKWN